MVRLWSNLIMLPPIQLPDVLHSEPGGSQLSAPRRRALLILHRDFPLAPAIFAHYMWPTSNSWLRSFNAGRGVRLKAITFLACLERDGLARRCGVGSNATEGYVLTDWGARASDLAPHPRYQQ